MLHVTQSESLLHIGIRVVPRLTSSLLGTRIFLFHKRRNEHGKNENGMSGSIGSC